MRLWVTFFFFFSTCFRYGSITNPWRCLSHLVLRHNRADLFFLDMANNLMRCLLSKAFRHTKDLLKVSLRTIIDDQLLDKLEKKVQANLAESVKQRSFGDEVEQADQDSRNELGRVEEERITQVLLQSFA